jgi:hypothetical protein
MICTEQLLQNVLEPVINTTADFFVIPVKTGIQAPSLPKQGTIKNWIPVFTGNPGYPLSRV